MAIDRLARIALCIAYAASIVAAADVLPDIPPFTGFDGERVFLGGPLIPFLLPITATVVWWVLASLSRAESSHGARRAGAVTALFLSAFHVTTLVAFLGAQLWLGRILGLLAGIFLIVTGNELPRLRRNLAWGIRTAQTLGSDDVWRRVHRLGGFVRVAMGLAVCIASLSGASGFAELIFFAVVVETVICAGAGLFFAWQKRTAAGAILLCLSAVDLAARLSGAAT
jgi:uncharacterized membrane protein